MRVDVHELFKAEDGNFCRKVGRNAVKTCAESEIFYALAEHGADGKLNHRNAGNFADVRYGAA